MYNEQNMLHTIKGSDSTIVNLVTQTRTSETNTNE